MMVKTDFYMTRPDGVKLYRTYSDAGMMIQKDGTEERYTEAVDIENSGFTYTETDTPIPVTPESKEEITAQKAAASSVKKDVD